MAPATNALKITGRQTNNSLSSISENIFLPVSDSATKSNVKVGPTTTTSSTTTAIVESKGKKIKKSKKDKVSAEVIPPGLKKSKKEDMMSEDTLQIGMHKILSHVKSHRDAWPFMDPVDEEIAPRYYSIIRRPMDLQKMEEKLDNGDYIKFSDFRNDFKLIVNNCRLYNGHHNEYTEMVNNLQEAFEKGTSKFLDHASEDEDDDLGFPDVKMNVFREKNSKKKCATKKSSAPQSEDDEFPQQQVDVKESLSANDSKEQTSDNKSKKPKKTKKLKKKSQSESEKSDLDSDVSEKELKPNKIPEKADDSFLLSSSKKKFFKNFAKKRKKYLNEDDKDDSDEEVYQKKKKVKSEVKTKTKKEKEYSFTESESSENETAFKVDLHKKYRMIADEEKELEAKKREESDFQLASMFMDKYDLIKQRRNRDSGKAPTTTVSSPQKRDPSPKRKEKPAEKEKSKPVEKEKPKIAEKEKPKPKQKKKESEGKEKSKKPPKPPPVKDKDENKDFEKEFDKLKGKAEKEEKENKKETLPEKPVVLPPSLPQKPKKIVSVPIPQPTAPPPPPTQPAAPSAPPPHKTTNVNDLNYEAEQTLKDISRWLEHTPKLPSEMSSASNSPSRYTNLIDEIDSKIASTNGDDFARSLVDEPKKVEATQEHEDDDKPNTIISEFISDVSSSKNSDENSLFTVITSPSSSMPNKYKLPSKKEPSSTQFLTNPPLPPHVKAQQKKEAKYKSLKEKLAGLAQPNKKKVERTTDRLQPGKTKGNLLQNIHKPTEDVIHLGVTAKIKEPVSSSGGIAADLKEDSSPKLSLGTVLDSGFDVLTTETPAITPDENNEKKEAEAPKECAKTQQASKPTPNLNAWFKAFGGVAPKKKKVEEPVVTPRPASPPTQPVISSIQPTQQQRQRKASTGSTVSERSSYSQDPDSPRIGIDDRYGAYNSAYTSPLGASPIMVSPKTDDIKTPPHSQPYQTSHQQLSQPGPHNPLNGGSIKVGFYQDTTTKSSPEKSCSPREVPLSPYPQYSQNMYGQSSSAAPSPNVSSSEMSANSPMSPYKCSSYNVAASKTPEKCSLSTGAGVYVEQQPDPTQYKQPRSQESDYNLSMSPATAPNTPQTNNSNSQSPYHQNSHSPYQQPHSPYQQQGSSVASPQQVQQPQQQKIESSPQSQHSPYHQQHMSPVGTEHYYQQAAVPQQTTVPQQTPMPQQQVQQQQQQVQNSFYNQITGGNLVDNKWEQQPRMENQPTQVTQQVQVAPQNQTIPQHQPQQQPQPQQAVNFSSLFNQEPSPYENLNLSTKQPEKQQTARIPTTNDAAKSTSMFDTFLNIGSIFNRNQDNLFPQQQTIQQKTQTIHQQPTHHQQQPQQVVAQQSQQQLVDHQQMNPFAATYKTPFGNPAPGLLDPSAHLRHPLLFEDPSMFYEKNSTPTPPNAHQLFPTSYLQQQTASQQVHQQQQQLQQNQFQSVPVPAPAPAKPKKTRKNAKATVQPTTTPAPQINQQQYYGHPSATAGFQAYAGMKNSPTNVNSNNVATTATDVIKSAVAAASAFNFAPSASTFSGLYPTDNTSYSLDDHFSRVAAVANSGNPYFSLTAGQTDKVNAGGGDNGNTANTTPYTSFRTSSPYHPATPFINSQMDTNSQFYQQQMVRHMMMNQGFLRPGAGAGYPHPQPPDFRTAPTLGMPKPYDVNNPRWY